MKNPFRAAENIFQFSTRTYNEKENVYGYYFKTTHNHIYLKRLFC